MRQRSHGRPLPICLLIVFVRSLPGEPQAADYIGAVRCGPCHPDKLRNQSGSEHAHALSRPSEHALAKSFVQEKTFIRSGKYSFRFLADQGQIQVHAFDNSREIDIPLEWAFGAGAQAVTFASRVNSEWYLEHALSYYSAARSYFTTPGQPAPQEDTLPAALGALYRSDGNANDIRHCFERHSTGPVTVGRRGQLQPSEAGVHCEACHGPGRLHAEAAAWGDLKSAKSSIENPARLPATGLNMFCGQCHRQPAPQGTETDWTVAWNVRHQPVYLNQSRCFRKSSGGLSCLSCHDAHQPLESTQAFYNSKCTGCHRQVAHQKASLPSGRPARDCIGCHMPRVSPQPWLRFTNHWIGIYSGGNMLVPRRSE